LGAATIFFFDFSGSPQIPVAIRVPMDAKGIPNAGHQKIHLFSLPPSILIIQNYAIQDCYPLLMRNLVLLIPPHDAFPRRLSLFGILLFSLGATIFRWFSGNSQPLPHLLPLQKEKNKKKQK
jgi:hypothetical protein